MKANLPKPPKMPKCWDRLPDYERQTILRIMTDTAYDIADKQLAETQEIWIKLACIILHDMGHTEEELFQFIAAWKRMYRRNARIASKEEQALWLDAEMKRCFPSCNFPQFRIDDMKGDHK